MSNFKPTGTPGTLIGEGIHGIPDAGSADANLLNQQTTYFALCNTYIAQTTPDKKQVFLLGIVAASPMTAASAAAYFSGITPSRWSTGVIDYKLALANMQAQS